MVWRDPTLAGLLHSMANPLIVPLRSTSVFCGSECPLQKYRGRYTPDKEGKILFISHQWLGFSHPDPQFDQLPALQRLIFRLMEGKIDVAQDPMGKMMFKQEGPNCTSNPQLLCLCGHAAKGERARPHAK